MTEPVLLSFEKHGKLHLNETKDFTEFKSKHLVPVVLHEFYTLATEFPLIFVRNSESGDFVPVAMMGLTKGKNLYCQTRQWRSEFIPSTFTLAPFSVRRLESDNDDAVIAVDEESPLLSESAGKPMFQANSEYTAYLRKRIDHVVTVTKQSLQTLALSRLLADKNLFRTSPLTFQLNANSTKYEVEGVYTIDEEALAKISDEDYLELRKRGLIPLIYSHLTSLHQFGRLLRLQDQADRKTTTTESSDYFSNWGE